MARARYEGVSLTEDLRPQARPVDTFVRVQEPSRDDTLTELARGLQGLGGALSATLGKRDAEKEESERLQGEAAFHTANGVGYAEGVANGTIPAQASKSFMEGYKRAQGANYGDQLQAKFQAAYDTWEGKTSTDPKAFDGFLNKFMQENLNGQNDPAVLKGLLPAVRQIVNNGQSAHIADVSRAVKADKIRQDGALNNRDIDNGNLEALATGKGFDAEAVFGKLEARRAEALKTGSAEADYDKALIDGVIQASVEKPESNILRFFERKVPGKDYTWAETPYGRDQLIKAKDAIETQQRKDVAEAARKTREQKAEDKDNVTRQVVDFISGNPDAPVPAELVKAGTRVDPDFKVNILRWQEAFRKQGSQSDPKALRELTNEIITNPAGAKEAVLKAIQKGTPLSAADLRATYNMAEKLAKGEGGGGDKLLTGQAARGILDTIKQRTMSSLDKTSLFEPKGLSDEGLQAQQDFRIAVTQWSMANPNASVIEREKAVGDIGAAILSRIGQEDGGFGKITYDRKGEAGAGSFPSTPPGLKPPEAAPAAPAQSITAQPPGARGNQDWSKVPPQGSAGEQLGNPDISGGIPQANPFTPEASPQPTPGRQWFDGLKPEQKQKLQDRAKESGEPVEAVIERLYQRSQGKQSDAGPRAPDGTPVAQASLTRDIAKQITDEVDAEPAPDVKEQTVQLLTGAFQRAIQARGGDASQPKGTYQLAVLKNDPQAARILDFVAGPESGGNYNAYFGNAGSKMPLDRMTLDQVAQWSSSRGTKSSATGRYQFMKATLVGKTEGGVFKPGLKQELGLTGKELFTPELQDRLALALLERRGYSQFKAGKLSVEQFSHNLASEWAGVPSLKTGRGVYDGDGLNMAKRSLLANQREILLTGAGRVAPSATPAVQEAVVQPTRNRLLTYLDRLLGRRV